MEANRKSSGAISEGPPAKILLHKKKRQLELVGGDGASRHIAFDELRRFCACSRCRASGRVGMLLVTDRSDICDVRIMGVAGLQIEFADGHNRGVYPWAYLLAIADGRALEHLAL